MKTKLILDMSYTRQGFLLLEIGMRVGKSCVEEMLKRVLGDGNLSPLEGRVCLPEDHALRKRMTVSPAGLNSSFYDTSVTVS